MMLVAFTVVFLAGITVGYLLSWALIFDFLVHRRRHATTHIKINKLLDDHIASKDSDD